MSGQKGHVLYRPYHSVPTGPHRILLMIKRNCSHNRKARGSILEAVVNIVLIANRSFDRASLRSGAPSFDFGTEHTNNSSDAILEIMLYSPGDLPFVITGIDFQRKTHDWNAAWPSISLAHGCAAATKDRNVSGVLPVSSINRIPQYIETIGESIEAFGNTCADGSRSIVDVSTNAGAIALSRCEDSADLPVSTRSLSSTISDRGRQNTETRIFYSAAISQLAPRGDTDANRWERAHFLYELDHLGQLTRASRILVGATMADEAIALLSEVAERVDVIDLTGSPPGAGAEGRLFWSNGMLQAGDRLVISEGSLEEAEAASYDAVAFPHSSLFSDGITNPSVKHVTSRFSNPSVSLDGTSLLCYLFAARISSGAPSLLAKAEQLFRPSGIF